MIIQASPSFTAEPLKCCIESSSIATSKLKNVFEIYRRSGSLRTSNKVGSIRTIFCTRWGWLRASAKASVPPDECPTTWKRSS